MLQMNQRTGNRALLIMWIEKKIHPCALRRTVARNLESDFICCIFTQETEVNLVGEPLIAPIFRLLEVLNQPQLYLKGFIKLFRLWKLLTIETYDNNVSHITGRHQ
ncbi:hypothetical protein ILYODFUR_028042 [Ilyodon furcidens]|uniref:Uncharacterized protein n=1 Tax=Ilyodon furcidens TaxID=33524 RepID=A0ABV0T1X9_9TELE